MLEPGTVEVRDEVRGEALIVRIEGELDLSSISVLASHVNPRTGTEREHAELTLDLGAVTFMDSSGLRFLIELNERAKRERWRLKLVAPRHEAATLVLRMTGADTALPFVEETAS